MAKECSNSSCNKSSCEGCGQKQPQSLMAEPNVFSDVKHVIGVVSGKGGVGKSFVTGSLANLMASKGYKVGIMDADITGPSIPKMYGIKGNAQGSDNGIYPMPTANGIEVMSVNLLLPDEETPVIWRGPVLANICKTLSNCHADSSKFSRFYKKSSDHCRYAHQQRILHRKFPAEAAKKTCTDRKTKSGKTWKHRNSLAYSHPHGISEIRFPRALITVYIAVIHNQQDHAGKKDPDPGKHMRRCTAYYQTFTLISDQNGGDR